MEIRKRFTLDKVPHLYINYIQLALTRRRCSIKLLEKIEKK